MKKFFLLLAWFSVMLAPSLRADEGMWLLPLLEKLNMAKMTELGLELTAEDIYSINRSSLKDAIVIFGGGCTGEIVSDQGLLFTNHHCGRSSIHYHSTVEHDYLNDGFWAAGMEEELPTPGLSVTFLIRMEKVTDRVLKKVKDKMSEEERMKKIRDNMEEIRKEATEGTHYRASVSSFFGGNEYYLLVYERYTDVRLVGAPPAAIGNFGADTDNWTWPRHTGDFSIFRVYTGPDGKPADYSPDNIPLKPRHYLPVSLKGVEEGDFAMILGYPGSTTRYITSYGIDEVLTITHPNRIKIRGLRQELMLEDMLASKEIMTKYRAKYSSSTNYWKYSIGQSEGLKRLKVKAGKEALEDRFTRWTEASNKRKKKYGEALELIRTSIEGRKEFAHAGQYLSECFMRGSEILGMARSAFRLYEVLGGEETDQETLDREISSLASSANDFYRNYNSPTDQKITAAMMELYAEDVPEKYHPEALKTITAEYRGDYQRFVQDLFSRSVFAGEQVFSLFLENPDRKVLEQDPAFTLARSVLETAMKLNEQAAAFDHNLEKGRRLYIAGLMEMDPSLVPYPDANFSMRLTYGTVQGYIPRDAVYYEHYTTLKGVMEKEDPDNWEFVVPEKLKELYRKKDFGRYGKDGIMPVGFITNNDITGGNSGSPVLNARGELIGLAFDGNWEAMSGDIAFEPDLQRCISVDIRYVLFLIDKFAGAKHLIEELSLRE
ncbi:MAG TPA: S46 family peptidase [Bacteroidetes bacterium]|nr:S46 family peptidase [Bacteroidota bacterium]